ncbi:gamma-glutamyl-gamma-aminobutyrate hydrolase family protein [bacterium]|nr:MAG: gamma-glutamyl-gamma-aminobutyrate hydrolase family protein [bacterium]
MVVLPKIGLTIGYQAPDKVEFLHRKSFEYLKESYIERVKSAGGLPVLLPNIPENVDDYLAYIDGLLLTGGLDVAPSLYGEERISDTVRLASGRRDEFEQRIVVAAVEKGIPVFGICRGFQMVIVAMGGTLYQDVSEREHTGKHTRDPETKERANHSVSIVRDSILYRILGSDRIIVNSSHHQIAKDVPDMFRVSAYADDGVFEGVETEDGRLIAVQWHPEEMENRNASALFEYLVNSAKGRG